MSNRLVVVSNRVSVPKLGNKGAEGGLAVALRAALGRTGGLWFGWSGEVTDRDGSEPHVRTADAITYATVDLSTRDHDEYYSGYANRTLWPLFHYRLDLTEFTRRDMAGYFRVNQGFARMLSPHLQTDDLVWVHDYHLIPLAQELRHAGHKNRMGFFIHIPWPSLGVLLALPNHTQLVRCLCAYDLLGFQTPEDVDNFCHYIRNEIGGRIHDNGTITAFGRTFRIGAFPIGIETDEFARLSHDANRSSTVRRLRESMSARDLIIGVDRLDYSKGLGQRLEAFGALLRLYPENRNRVIYLQVAPHSRSSVPEYRQMQEEVATLAGRINGQFAEFDWTPIRYMNKSISRRILAGFYRIARIGLVTPLRDGMNLVAKEFVAAQDPEDPGVLVLSRFAGAARELTGALLVNPYDTEGAAIAIQTGMVMPLDERKARWSSMMETLQKQDVFAWADQYVAELRAAPTDGGPAQ